MFSFAQGRAIQASCNAILCYMVRSATDATCRTPSDPVLQNIKGVSYTGFSTWRIELYKIKGKVTADHLVHHPCTRFHVLNGPDQEHAEHMKDISSFYERAASYCAM